MRRAEGEEGAKVRRVDGEAGGRGGGAGVEVKRADGEAGGR